MMGSWLLSWRSLLRGTPVPGSRIPGAWRARPARPALGREIVGYAARSRPRGEPSRHAHRRPRRRPPPRRRSLARRRDSRPAPAAGSALGRGPRTADAGRARGAARDRGHGHNRRLPPELVGTHVGPPRAHTTHRVTDLSFRLATALFGHAGIEWDITQCDDAERSTIRAWAALYVELRPLLHGGETVRTDLTDDGTILHGVVAPDRSHAVFC